MTASNPFVGTWKLVSWEVTQPDGRIHYPYSNDVVGYLIYTADGYMSAEIMDPDRQQSDPNFPLQIGTAQTLPNSDRARAPLGAVLSIICHTVHRRTRPFWGYAKKGVWY
jgi:hypothetical protein